MRFARVVDGSLEFAPKMFETSEGKVITNSPEIYATYGYKPIVPTDPPEVPDGYENVYHWEDSENGCLQVCLGIAWRSTKGNGGMRYGEMAGRSACGARSNGYGGSEAGRCGSA